MAHTEGEKELVLGNKQLISLFFVIVALCGVFFALGYMMGRPSGKQVTGIPETSAAPTSGGTVSPIPAPAQESSQSEPPRETAPTDVQPAPADTQPEPPSTHTQAARDVPPAPAPTPTPAAPPAREEGATYLQVRALGRADAANLVKTLKEQNFPALLAESSKPDLFRVLVGPYHQTSDVADAKARLKALGFADAFVQK